jgi:hypothetical protein
MNDEVELVRELRPDVPLPLPDELAPARSRLLASVDEPGSGRIRPRRRLAVAGGLATVAAVAVAVVLVVTIGLVKDGPTALPTDTGPTVSGSAGESTPQVQPLAAADVLRRAATAAAAQPATVPRPDQFVFVDTVGGNGYRHLMWRSVDGTRDGLVRIQQDSQSAVEEIPDPGCRNGPRAIFKGSQRQPGSEPCTPTPAFDPNMPTDAASMVTYLQNMPGGEPGDVYSLGENVQYLAAHTYLLPASRAALYEAALTIPGLEAVPDEVDANGRHGVGVAFAGPSGSRYVLIFDGSSYEYLGLALTDLAGGVRTAMRNLTIVDGAGQLP